MKSLLRAVLASVLMTAWTLALAAGVAADGEKKSAACQQCHGKDGNSVAAQFPNLAGQHADYIVKALQDYKSGRRTDPVMTGFAAQLSAQDREDLGAYYATQKGLYTIDPD